MNEKNIELLKQIKLEAIHIAYDRYTDKDIVEKKMKMFKEMTGYNKNRGRVTVYIGDKKILYEKLQQPI